MNGKDQEPWLLTPVSPIGRPRSPISSDYTIEFRMNLLSSSSFWSSTRFQTVCWKIMRSLFLNYMFLSSPSSFELLQKHDYFIWFNFVLQIKPSRFSSTYKITSGKVRHDSLVHARKFLPRTVKRNRCTLTGSCYSDLYSHLWTSIVMSPCSMSLRSYSMWQELLSSCSGLIWWWGIK